MDSKICDSESGAEVEIADADFIAAITHPLVKILEASLNINETGGYLLVAIYPVLKGGEEWTPGNLYHEFEKNPELKDIIKNRATFIYNLDALTKVGILKKIEGDTTKGNRYALKELVQLQFLDLILTNKEFKGFLEEHYTYLYILSCMVARLVQTVFPNDSASRLFDLTTLLLEGGVKLAIKDLASRRVLERQCSNCYYPYHPVELGMDEPLTAATDAPIKQTPTTLPLYDQLKQFLEASQEGKSKAEIFDHFSSLGQPESAINQALIDLINQGDARINAGRYILNT